MLRGTAAAWCRADAASNAATVRGGSDSTGVETDSPSLRSLRRGAPAAGSSSTFAAARSTVPVITPPWFSPKLSSLVPLFLHVSNTCSWVLSIPQDPGAACPLHLDTTWILAVAVHRRCCPQRRQELAATAAVAWSLLNQLHGPERLPQGFLPRRHSVSRDLLTQSPAGLGEPSAAPPMLLPWKCAARLPTAAGNETHPTAPAARPKAARLLEHL